MPYCYFGVGTGAEITGSRDSATPEIQLKQSPYWTAGGKKRGRTDLSLGGTIRVWNPSDDSIVIEPTLLLHQIVFKRTSNLARYLDTIELGPKEQAEFQIEVLEEAVPAGFRPLSVEFISSNRCSKFAVTFEFLTRTPE